MITIIFYVFLLTNTSALTNLNSFTILSVLFPNWMISPHSCSYCCGHKPILYSDYNREVIGFPSSPSLLKLILHFIPLIYIFDPALILSKVICGFLLQRNQYQSSQSRHFRVFTFGPHLFIPTISLRHPSYTLVISDYLSFLYLYC